MICAFLAGLAVWLLIPSAAHARRRMSSLRPSVTRPKSIANPMFIRAACVVAGLAIALTLGGVLGWVLGIVAAIVGPIVLAKVSGGTSDVGDAEIRRHAPNVAELLAACLASGATTKDATAVVADAVGDPCAAPLRSVVAAIELGASEASAWQLTPPGLAPIARAVTRSSRSGAPLATLLAQLADDLRRERRIAVEVAARSAGVRAVAPLAVCFLPAFLLLSVVPIVVDLGTSMLNPQG